VLVRRGLTVLVGAVSQLYQGDLDFGRRVLDGLPDEPGVAVAMLDYGAVAVAQDLQDLRPGALVLVGAAARGRPPGTLERHRIAPPELSAADVRTAIAEAVTGYVGLDLLIDVAAGLGALPASTVTIELEPVDVWPSERLSPPAEAALAPARRMVISEARRRLRAAPAPAGGSPPVRHARSRAPGLRP
jgi:hypothetical protein